MRSALISFLLAVLASAAWLVLPAYTGTTGTMRVSGDSRVPVPEESYVRHAKVAEVNGPRTYALLAFPVVVAGLPLLFRRRAIRSLAAAVLTGWVVISAASLGVFYIPSAIVMIWSALTKSA